MVAKCLWVAGLGALVYGGFWLLDRSSTYYVEVQTEPPGPRREEEILRAFFTEDVAQKKLAHLELSDLQDFEAIAQPRPDRTPIVEQFGPPDSIVEMDLTPFGILQRGRIYHYRRLGLVTPAESDSQQVFWLLIEGRARAAR